MLTGIVFLIGATIVTYVSFRMYFTWCSFEPLAPNAFPDNQSIQFETILCTALFLLHINFYILGDYLLSSAAFWMCAGNVVGAGVFPPVPSEKDERGFIARIVIGLWKSKFSGFIVSSLVSAYLYFFRWATFPRFSEMETLLMSGLSLGILVSLSKALAAVSLGVYNNQILVLRVRKIKICRILITGFVGHISVIALLLHGIMQLPVPAAEDTGHYEEIYMIVSVFLGVIFRI